MTMKSVENSGFRSTKGVDNKSESQRIVESIRISSWKIDIFPIEAGASKMFASKYTDWIEYMDKRWWEDM